MKNRGVLMAIGAYGLWGFLPLYWKSIKTVTALEILCHRAVWSLLFLAAILFLQKHWQWIKNAIKTPRIVIRFLGTAVILAINWLTYIWAVNAGFLVEVSLGYFINPLINVVLGVIFLKERLRLWQLIAIAGAAIGVCYLTFSYGSFPWIALTLAFSFGFYGLLQKTASLNSLEGLSFEMAVLFIPALGYLIHLGYSGTDSFGHSEFPIPLLLMLTGIVTAIPLLLFASAAKKITLTNLGLIQYLTPTLHFFLGVFLYGEEFTPSRLIGFVIIWTSLIIYTAEGIIKAHTSRNNKPI